MVIAIVAILAGMLMPALSAVKTSARSNTCLSNQRQIGLAVVAYTGDWDGCLPYATINSPFAPVDVYAYNWGCWAEENIVGQYLEATGPATIRGGIWPPGVKPHGVLHCPDSGFLLAGAKYLEYGLSKDLCKEVLTGWPMPPLALAAVKSQSQTALATDASVSHWTTTARLAGYLVFADPSLPVSWANVGNNRPDAWIMRHRRGANLLFVDGHVRWSRNVSDEDRDRTVYTLQSMIP